MSDHQQPIVVLCMGRSGSSMTAGVFAQHGVWTGDCMPADRRNAKGYFENKQVKKHITRMCGTKVSKVYPPVKGWRDRMERIKRSEGYVDGEPWLVKHNVIFYQLWSEYEAPRFVLTRRDSDAIFRSVRASGFHRWQDDDSLRLTIEVHQQTLDHVRDKFGAVEVDTRAVVSGDTTTLVEALEYAGIEPRHDVIRSFVDPSLWHQEVA